MRRGIDERLIGKREIAAFDRYAQIELQRVALRAIGIHGRIVERHAGAAGFLGLIHGKVGAAHQFLPADRTERRHGDADAGADHDDTPADFERFGKEIEDLLRKLQRGRILRIRKESDREFITADAREHGILRDQHVQSRRNSADQLVAGAMTITVVDLLEAVEIEIEQQDVPLRLPCFCNEAVDGKPQAIAIGKAAQAVTKCFFPRTVFLRLQPPPGQPADDEQDDEEQADQTKRLDDHRPYLRIADIAGRTRHPDKFAENRSSRICNFHRIGRGKVRRHQPQSIQYISGAESRYFCIIKMPGKNQIAMLTGRHIKLT